MSKRKVMTLDEIRAESYLEDANELGICALVDVENMGFCDGDQVRWYHFKNAAGEDCVYYKYGSNTDFKKTKEEYEKSGK